MTWCDRFEVQVPLPDAEVIKAQWEGFPKGSGAVHVYVGWAPGEAKVEVWGEAAQDALYWYIARENPLWKVQRIDIKQDLPAVAFDNEELRDTGVSLMRDVKIRAVVGVREQDRQQGKGTTEVTIGSYHSAKSLAVYGRDEGWRIEARFKTDAARMLFALLKDASFPERVVLDAIERVQWDLCKEVIWPVGGVPLDLRIPQRAGQNKKYTPSERIRRGTKALIVLAEKHGLWNELAESIPEVYAALHARAQQEKRWEQAELAEEPDTTLRRDPDRAG